MQDSILTQAQGGCWTLVVPLCMVAAMDGHNRAPRASRLACVGRRSIAGVRWGDWIEALAVCMVRAMDGRNRTERGEWTVHPPASPALAPTATPCGAQA